jgi:hypothetical protein
MHVVGGRPRSMQEDLDVRRIEAAIIGTGWRGGITTG